MSTTASQAVTGRLTTLSSHSTQSVLLVFTALFVTTIFALMQLTILSANGAVVSTVLWTLIAALVWREMPPQAVQPAFGIANMVTTMRALMTSFLAGYIMHAQTLSSSSTDMWWVICAAAFTLSLDGIDGWIARKTNSASEFGARFDMEVDALLILVLSLFIWQANIAGIWIIALGLMRYAFIAAGTLYPALTKPLFPSNRRKVVCVQQVISLGLMLVPLISSPAAAFIGILALICLSISFAIDIIWLLRHSQTSLPKTQDADKESG